MEIYLQKFGVCSVDYDDYIQPVLFERPEGIIKKLRAVFEVDNKVFFNSIDNIIRNKQKILEKISKLLSEEEYLTFQKKLNSAEKAFLVTDTHNYYIERQSWGYLRLAVMKAAKIMKSKDIINNTDEVFFLTFEELIKSLEMKKVNSSVVIERKKIFQNQKSLLPPRYIGKDFMKCSNSINRDKCESVSNSSIAQLSLKGIATFQYKIKGKIIKGIPQNLDEDCILVVFHGHASDITHLLRRVKGLIFENGSPFDHLGIISKEMNIPVVYYVNNALSILNNGDLVEIDGTKGEINILKVNM
jgi:Phosphoenolpyruvate-protein kinase (PTS system EI component in bacteria)